MVKMVYTVRRYRKRPEAHFNDIIDPDDDEAFKAEKDLMFDCLADGEDLLFLIRTRIRLKEELVAMLLEAIKPTLETLTAEIDARERDMVCKRYLALRAQVVDALAPIEKAFEDIKALEAEIVGIEEEQSAVMRYYYLRVFGGLERRQHEREVIKVPFVLHL